MEIWQNRYDEVRISSIGRDVMEPLKFTCFKIKKLEAQTECDLPKATYPDKAKLRPDPVTTKLVQFHPH